MERSMYFRPLTNQEHLRYKCASDGCKVQADYYGEAGNFHDRVGSYFCRSCKMTIQSMAVVKD